MATATLVAAYKDDVNAYASARVVEANGNNVEYNACTPLLDVGGQPKPNAQLKTDLTAALKAARDSRQPKPITTLPISGTVTI